MEKLLLKQGNPCNRNIEKMEPIQGNLCSLNRYGPVVVSFDSILLNLFFWLLKLCSVPFFLVILIFLIVSIFIKAANHKIFDIAICNFHSVRKTTLTRNQCVCVCVYPFIFTDFLELLGHTTCQYNISNISKVLKESRLEGIEREQILD